MSSDYTTNAHVQRVSQQQGGKEFTISEGFDGFDSLTAGALPLATTGGTTTLTTEQARNALFIVTGALTGNATVNLPSGSDNGRVRRGRVYNNTTGNFSLTIGYQGGAGFIVPQGFAQSFWHDGVNVYPEGPPLNTAGAVPGCLAYRSSTQSINNAALMAINFTAERFDTAGAHDNSTNNTRLTCTAAGVYAINFNLEWASNATGYRQALVMLNGTTYIAIDTQLPVTGDTTKHTVSRFYRLAVGDYIEAQGYQTSGGALNVAATGNYGAEFGMIYLGA